MHYVVWDRLGTLGPPGLYAFELRGDLYQTMKDPWFESLGLGLVEWHGTFETMNERWLRWRLADGSLVLTGAERAEAERARAEAASARADALAAKLRALGIDPDDAG